MSVVEYDSDEKPKLKPSTLLLWLVRPIPKILGRWTAQMASYWHCFHCCRNRVSGKGSGTASLRLSGDSTKAHSLVLQLKRLSCLREKRPGDDSKKELI